MEWHEDHAAGWDAAELQPVEDTTAAYVPDADIERPQPPPAGREEPLFGSAGYRYDIENAVSDDGNPVVGDTAGRLYDSKTGEELSKY
jgi:hypothetical protein